MMGGLVIALGCLFTSFASQFHQMFFSLGIMIGNLHFFHSTWFYIWFMWWSPKRKQEFFSTLPNFKCSTFTQIDNVGKEVVLHPVDLPWKSINFQPCWTWKPKRYNYFKFNLNLRHIPSALWLMQFRLLGFCPDSFRFQKRFPQKWLIYP